MFRTLFLVLLLVPAVELYVLIQVGSVIGALPTIALTIVTALAGAALMRSQGLMTLQTLQVQLAQGARPESTLVEGALIVLGGMLLLIPGFITDALGLALLLPPLRKRLASGVVRRQTGAPDDRGGIVVEGEVVSGDEAGRLPPRSPTSSRDG